MTTPDWRSLLFVAGDGAALIGKAAASEADAVILDLEDAVSPRKKAKARGALSAAISAVRAGGKGVIVRINAFSEDTALDLEAAAVAGVDAIMAPKSNSVATLVALCERLSEWEQKRGLAPIGVIPLIECAQGVLAAGELAAAPRAIALAFGSEDFSLDLGVAPTRAALDLPCRHICLAARARKIGAYAMPVSIAAFRDEAATLAAATEARAYGAQGALCVHPLQVAIVNRAFAATPEEVADAQAIASAWRQALEDGRSVVSLNGRMIDAPVAARAARTLRIAKAD